MKFIKIILTLYLSCFISSCTYSQDMRQNKESLINNTKNITQDDVFQCQFDHEYINFCSNKHIELYNKKIKSTPNFANDKILLVIDARRDIGKGLPRVVKSIVVLDPKTNKVFSLIQTVGHFVDNRLEEIEEEPAQIKFSKNNNKLCLSGTTYSYKDNNINVENECYRFNIKSFEKISKNKLFLKNNEPFVLPYDSTLHKQCILNFDKQKCSKIKLISSKNLLKKYDFINPQDGDSLILPKNEKTGIFLILSPFEDETGDSLRIMKVKGQELIGEKFISTKQKATIDKDYNLEYFEGKQKRAISLK